MIKKSAAMAILSMALSFSLLHPSISSAATNQLTVGTKHFYVYKVERMLSALNYNYKLVVNTYYSKSTAYNVKKFQRDHGLKANGIVDYKTYYAIRDAYRDLLQKKQKDHKQPATQPVSSPVQSMPAEQGRESTHSLTAEEKLMVELINQERAKSGLPALRIDPKLAKVARIKAQEMVDKHYFSHTSPTYGSPFDMMKTFGIAYRAAGENIAGNSSVEKAHQSLMNSDGHRANILSSSFDSVGIGIVDGGPYGKMFVQMFIKK